MQEGIINPPHWLQLILAAIASLVARDGIVKVYHIWLNRKKPAAEVHLTDATATEVTIRSHATAGDSVVRMMNRLDTAQVTIDRLRGERDDWQLRAFDLQVELNEMKKQNAQLNTDVGSMDHQMRKQMAFIIAKELKDEYIAMDQPKE